MCWLEHGYVFGLLWLNHKLAKPSSEEQALHELDHLRLKSLQQGTRRPATIPEWSGWWVPAADDLLRIHQLVGIEYLAGIRSCHEGSWQLICHPEDNDLGIVYLPNRSYEEAQEWGLKYEERKEEGEISAPPADVIEEDLLPNKGKEKQRSPARQWDEQVQEYADGVPSAHDLPEL